MRKTNFSHIDKIHVLHEMLLLAQRYEAKTFVETGAHLGMTSLFMAASGHFDRIHAVELSDDLYECIKQDLPAIAEENHIDMSRAVFWHGDAVDCLPQILNRTEERCVFWLDAHSAGDGRELSELGDCVLEHELAAIGEHSVKDHVIVIDDMSYCRDGLSDYPSVERVIRMVQKINPEYCITVKYNALWAEVPSTSRAAHLLVADGKGGFELRPNLILREISRGRHDR